MQGFVAGQRTLHKKRRAIVVIIDGCGIGAAPDASKFGDAASVNTLANVAVHRGGLHLPSLVSLGLGNIHAISGLDPVAQPSGFFGKLEEVSAGKDTQTGHWELMGLVSTTAFPTYPDGFRKEILDKFIAETGCQGVLCNKAVSGTRVLDEFGEEHQKTGYPIVYTSGDSVFQIACHVGTHPLPTLYRWCVIARQMLQGPDLVGRVIARPFTGSPGSYKRLGGDRRDYSVSPPKPTLLEYLQENGAGVLGIGKIEDIFDRQGLTHSKHTGSNREGLELTLAAVSRSLNLKPLSIVKNAPDTAQLIFTNLVDTDMLFGHRRNADGYAQALMEVDEGLGRIVNALGREDLLVITSDHGNDPLAPGTDHTREYVPVIFYSPSLSDYTYDKKNLGVQQGFFVVGASLASWLGLKWDGPGISFIPELAKVG